MLNCNLYKPVAGTKLILKTHEQINYNNQDDKNSYLFEYFFPSWKMIASLENQAFIWIVKHTAEKNSDRPKKWCGFEW